MNLDQAIATLREFRQLTLGPELSEAIDVVVAEHERRVLPMAPKHNMADASELLSSKGAGLRDFPPAGFYSA